MTKNKTKKILKKAAAKQAVAMLAANMAQVSLKVKGSKKKKTSKSLRAGAITTVNTAPVSIGNSIKGSSNREIPTANGGVRVIGRDFMFQPVGTKSTINDWTTVGGCPLTPACFADSVLSNYMRMYAKFRFRSVVAHYITSSATSSTGDVMFYYNKDRSSVYLNQTSTNLLNFVLSDDNTVIGPQWTNHSAQFKMGQEWKLCDYGMHSGVEEYADGDMFLLSKTSTTDSPGYVLFDYDIEFAEKNVAIRLIKFPMTQILWNPVAFGVTALAVTTSTVALGQINTKTTIASATSAWPTGSEDGDVYKIIIDYTNSLLANSAWTNVTASQLLLSPTGTAMTVSDGMTIYGVRTDATVADTMKFYPNVESAYTESSPYLFGVAATITYALCANISYVGSIDAKSVFPSY